MQFPRYSASLSHVPFNSNGLFQISAKDIDRTGIAARMWKNKLRYADYPRRVPEARGNIEQRGAATGPATDMRESDVCRQRKKPFKSWKHECEQRERNLLWHRRQNRFEKSIFVLAVWKKHSREFKQIIS